MNTHILSKSSFLRGLQCEKQLYLFKHRPEWSDKLTDMQKAIFSRGTDVGKLAQQLYPRGIDASPKSYTDYSESLTQTKELIEQKQNVIYEAAFQFDDVLVASDIVVRDGDKWKVFEVKSSTSVNDVHVNDAAVQYYVLSGCGLDISDFSIIFINNQYVREGELDIQKLFASESILEFILPLQEAITEQVKHFKSVIAQNEIPKIDIGEYCTYPYQCPFMGYCWKHVPENSVFDISNMHLRKKFELYKEGIIRIADIPSNVNLSKNQQLQVDSFKNDESYINTEAIEEFLNTIQYPVYFMDFETFQPAVPLFDKSKPYQQIPFQYSLHYKSNPDGRLKHFEFLAEPGEDPRKPFIENLLKETEKEGNILVYNKAFEVARLNEIASDFPEYSEQIEERILRIKDLMIPFQRKYYYKPEMQGSHSIKYVLPALVPDLTYNKLEISEGSMASLAYEALFDETDMFRKEEIKNQLLEYCKIDTFGMVKILEVLEETTN